MSFDCDNVRGGDTGFGTECGLPLDASVGDDVGFFVDGIDVESADSVIGSDEDVVV